MRPMYEIVEDVRRLAEAIEANGGELTPEMERSFDEFKDEFEHKADNYLAAITNYSEYAGSLQSEIARLSALKKTAERTADRLRERLIAACEAAGVDNLRLRRFVVRVCDSPTAYKWDSEAGPIPPELRKEVVEFSPTKARLLAEEGRLPPGVRVIRSKHLRIR